MKAIVTLEIEVKDNIANLYPNFIFNYDDKQEFLLNLIASLNHNIDNGYKQTVKKITIV